MIARRSLLLGATVLLGACAAPRAPLVQLPLLRLPPAALGRALSLVQRLSVRRLDAAADAPPQTVEVLLEADGEALRLAGFALNQRVLTMAWDGRELQVKRHPLLPAEVDTDRMLRDLTLVLWPAEAIRAALPAGWTLDADARTRVLRDHGEPRLTIAYGVAVDAPLGPVTLSNLAEGYALEIESRVQQ